MIWILIILFFGSLLINQLIFKNQQNKEQRIYSVTEQTSDMTWSMFYKDFDRSTDRIIANVIENEKIKINEPRIYETFDNHELGFFSKVNHQRNSGTLQRLELLKNHTLRTIDKYATSQGLTNYSIVDVTRSSNPEIPLGTYLYKFNDNDDLLLLRAPCAFFTRTEVMHYKDGKITDVYDPTPVFTKTLKKPKIEISNTQLKDFHLYGTQLMQSTITSDNNIRGGVGPIISEVIFGAAHTMLKGLNAFSIRTEHSIVDTRVVQVTFDNKTDVEFSGVQIYMDLIKLFGAIKNKN